MFAFIEDPYKTLPKAGYTMCGTSNAFRRHVKPKEWYHAYVSHDELSIAIHYDTSKQTGSVMYRKHKTHQNHSSLGNEIARIKTFQ